MLNDVHELPQLNPRLADLAQQFGLLSAGALLVVVMQDNNLTALASLDGDFDRVPGITRYSPV